MLPESDRKGLEELVTILEMTRDEARERLLEAIREPAYVALLDDLVEAAREPRVLEEAAAARAATALRPSLERPWNHLERAVEQARDDGSDASLHGVRIRAKRARYAAEAVSPVFGKRAAGLRGGRGRPPGRARGAPGLGGGEGVAAGVGGERGGRVRRGRALRDRGAGRGGRTSHVAEGLEGALAQAATLLGVSQPVRAAGGIVLRGEEADRSVALVHRPRYDDWSFPKGKLDDGEDEATAALREVEEETGLRCHLGPIVGAVTYKDRRGRPKVVRYFQMDADGGTFAPNHEVDELRWVPVEDAARLLSYAHDRRLLRRVLGGTPAYALYVVRHAKAGIRAAWTGPDQERPLTRRGRKQACRLVERFQGLDIERILSSPFLRCVQTVEPLGEARGLPVEVAPSCARARASTSSSWPSRRSATGRPSSAVTAPRSSR